MTESVGGVSNRPLLPGPSDDSGFGAARRLPKSEKQRLDDYYVNLPSSVTSKDITSGRSLDRIEKYIESRPDVINLPVNLYGAKTPDLWIPYDKSSKGN